MFPRACYVSLEYSKAVIPSYSYVLYAAYECKVCLLSQDDGAMAWDSCIYAVLMPRLSKFANSAGPGDG